MSGKELAERAERWLEGISAQPDAEECELLLVVVGENGQTGSAVSLLPHEGDPEGAEVRELHHTLELCARALALHVGEARNPEHYLRAVFDRARQLLAEEKGFREADG